MIVSFLDFLFVSHIPDWLLEKPAIQKKTVGADKNKGLLSLAKGPGNGQPSKTENYYYSTPQEKL